MKKFGLVFLIAVMIVSLSAYSEGEKRLELKLRYWFADFDAETSIVEDLAGGRVDLDDELRVGNDDLPELWLRWQFKPRHSLNLRYMQFDYWGEAPLLEGLKFDDRFIGISNQVRADLKLKYFKLGWRRTLLESEKVKVETILDAAIFDIDAKYKARIWLLAPLWTVDEDDIDGIGGLPLVGLGVDIAPLNRLNIFGEVSGMYAGSYGHILDAEAGIRYSPWEWLGIEAGYRYFEINAKEIEDEDTIVELSGPFVGVNVKF